MGNKASCNKLRGINTALQSADCTVQARQEYNAQTTRHNKDVCSQLPTILKLEARVRQRVESGMYGSASEVIREALRLFEAYEQVKTAKLDSLRQDIAKCLSDAKNGRAREIDFDSLKQQGRQLLRVRKAA